ncbi:MAG: hypothetical protein WKF42_01175 [Solirubrobacteraceae bacterium]
MKPKILIIAAAVVLVAALIVVPIVLLSGGDDEQQSARDASQPAADDERGDDQSSEPSLRTFSSDRATGMQASAQTDSIVRGAREVWLRVSAAPKQPTTVSWSITCGGGASDLDNYRVTPPDIRKLRLPKQKASFCTASAAAQLSGNGRLKVALLRDR